MSRQRSRANRIDVGDFVYCRSPYHRSELGLPKDAGLILEVKRNNCRILYGRNQFCWLPERTIVRIEGSVDTATFAGRLHWMIKRFKALDCELLPDQDLHRAMLRIDVFDEHMLDELRKLLGEDFVSFRLVPEGMAFMLAEVTFKS